MNFKERIKFEYGDFVEILWKPNPYNNPDIDKVVGVEVDGNTDNVIYKLDINRHCLSSWVQVVPNQLSSLWNQARLIFRYIELASKVQESPLPIVFSSLRLSMISLLTQ